MFCPSCGRNNKENAVFCSYCRKALPKKEPLQTTFEPDVKQYHEAKIRAVRGPRLSFRAIKAIVTVILVAVLVFIILFMYYPGVLPWNW